MHNDNVYLYIPNLIGYMRIILLLLSMFYMLTAPFTAATLYMLSSILDHFDGVAARHFNQTSNFGAFLDMLTDRCCTNSLLMVLCILRPAYTFLFQLLATIDFSSHWIYCQSSYLKGKTSHKIITSDNPVLVFYNNEIVLTVMCLGNEAFYTLLYLYFFAKEQNLGMIPTALINYSLLLTLPIAVGKVIVNFVQLKVGCADVVNYDKKMKGLKEG